MRLGRPAPEAPPRRRPARVLTASGRRINLQDRNARGPKREDWQRQAWDYRSTIPELWYGSTFLAKGSSKVRVVPAVAELDGAPATPLIDVEGLPTGLLAAVDDALGRLTADTNDWKALLRPFAVNFLIPGEAYLIGRDDPDSPGDDLYEIRSSSEVEKTDRGWTVLGDDGQSKVPVGPDAYVARLWAPNDEFRHLADSPMRALLGVCEELLITSRMIRAASRSRLAGAGMLLLPDSIDIVGGVTPVEQDPEEAEASPFFEDLTRTMLTALEDEGDAASVVPIVVRAEAEAIAAVKHLTFAQPVDKELLTRQEAALRRLAAGLDLPPEVITGTADINHWGAWAVDSSTIRNHIEPLAARMLDALTAAYLRPVLIEEGIDPSWARQVILTPDISPLTEHPNRLDDVIKLHGANPEAVSTLAMVEAAGLDPEADMPDEEEVARRIAWQRGTVDNTLMRDLIQLVTALKLEDPPTPPQLIPSQPVSPPELPSGDDPTTPQPDTGLPIAAAAAPSGPVLRAYVRESERLARADRETRDRLAAAADAAIARAVERATSRAASAANKTPAARAIAASAAPGRAYAALHEAGLTAALGLDPEALLAGAWDQLRAVWDRLTGTAYRQAFEVVHQITGGGMVLDASRIAQLKADGWEWLAAALTRETTRALEDPESETGVAEEPGEDPGRPGRVTSVVRGALAVAGGLPAGHPGIALDGVTASGGTPPGGIASGDMVTGLLHSAGRDVIGYEWVYGISKNHFEPHRRLDGVLFANFASPSLQNPESWPSATLAPGDHRGCHCDAQPVWADGRLASLEQDAAADATYDDSYLRVLRQIAADDRAAGRTDTTPIATVDEADRIANVRPSRRS